MFSQPVLLWFQVLPDLLPALPGPPRFVNSVPRLVSIPPRCLHACSRHSQTCHWRCQVLSGEPKILSVTPSCSQTAHILCHGTPVPVIWDPSYSVDRQENTPRVWYFPELDPSKSTLHILTVTPGCFQWQNTLWWCGIILRLWCLVQSSADIEL
jgi:hypothetical protein